jgi:serine/threonine protein kinase
MKPLAPNSLIQNRYLIVHLIGKGGMGEVYLAVDQRLGSAVALKRTFFADDEMLGGAFEREARTLARLRHPVLPKVSDHFIENGEQYLVMEHIAGDDLAKRLEVAQKPFPLSWVLYWADQLLDALAYLHSHEPPIIHRDIKPQNLKLTDENHIVLLDFGLSKNTTGQSKLVTSGSSGSVVGYTPHYAPMEQIRGTGTNPKSDIYSLSATLYQLMSNVVPADALTRADALLNGTPDPIAPLNELNPEISPEISLVILRGMEVSQERRFTNAKEMQRTLRKAYSQMQEAMSAQTVAFTAPETYGSKIEHPGSISGKGEEAIQHQAGESEEATWIRTDRPEASPYSVDSGRRDAEAAEYGAVFDSAPRQADVKTEVYQADLSPIYQAAGSEVDGAPQPVPDFLTTSIVDAAERNEEWSPEVSFDPNATVPVVAFSNEPTPAAFESYDRSPAAVGNDPFATRTEAPATSPAGFVSSHVTQKKTKRSSKAIWVVGTMAVLFFVTIITAGVGIVFYNQYYSGNLSLEPSPEPTVEATPLPTPEPTFEAIIDSNSNVSSVAANSNSASDVTVVEPTPSPDANTEPSVVTRPSPQIGTRKTPGRTGTSTPGTKPTPKPKSSDRTVILQ